MLDGIAESASDWFLACNFVKGLGTPLPSDYLIGHEYVVCEMLLNELARPRTFPQHTLPLLPLLRSRPGGVHKACVVRSPGSDKKLNRRLSMREHSQQTVDAEMKQRVRDYRNYNRQEQRVTTVRARTRDNALKRQVKRVADRDNKLHKPSAAAGRHQSQEKTHPEESVDYPENVIDNLRDARKRSRTLDF